VRCFIFRPDNYQLGAWRVEIRLPLGVQRFWNGSPFQFDIPQLAKRHFIMGPEFSFGPSIGCFIDGVWKADLYSNGIEEAKNPTSLAEIKRELLQRVNKVITSGGYGDDGDLMFVHDDAGKIIGTVQLRNKWYESWHRARTVGRPGNSHRLLGRFASSEEAIAAVRASS
jgi:hypothetical protein